MNRLKLLWNNLRGSFWFVPSLILTGSILLAVVLIDTDSGASRSWEERWPRLFGAGAGGARDMLSTIAGSMMTVVGVTFSMTLVTLTLASSQYTSRILRNFMKDRVTQVVLGIFAGIFAYCLIVLRTIRGGVEDAFIPSVAVSFGVVLAIGGIGALIFFIHHIASSIQASNIIGSVASETIASIDQLFPEVLGEGPLPNDEDEAAPELPEANWQTIPAHRNGFIQNIDTTALMRLAGKRKTVVRMERGIGAFAIQGTPLVSLSLESPPDEELTATLLATFSISRFRTLPQDAAFGIRQIVDIALRALSPSTNDTTTAIVCLDYLTAILTRLASRNIPSNYRYDEGGLRVIGIGPSFASLVAESFDQIRASGTGNAAILSRILDALETIDSLTDKPCRRQTLRDQMRYLAESVERTLQAPNDQAVFKSRLAKPLGAAE